MEQSRTTVSVIVATYERPKHLWFTLLALNRQTVAFDEIVIADDGSAEETRAAIEKFSSQSSIRTVHVWQKHEDNRVARSRNNAIRAATGEYLVFLDQDCVPSADFLKAHVSIRQPRVFLVGSCVFLDEAKTGQLTEADVRSGRLEELLDEVEMKKLRKAHWKDNFYGFFRRYLWAIKSKPKLRGGNFSIHKADLLAVNGFDENYVGWGQEDDDLGRRLYLAGMSARSVIASAITFHLHHSPPSGATPRWRDGRNVQYFLRKNVSPFAQNGLMKETGAPPEDVQVRLYR